MDLDYPPVTTEDDDEEESLRGRNGIAIPLRGYYAPPVSHANSAPPSQSAPPEVNASPSNFEMPPVKTAYKPNLQDAITGTIGARPAAPTYAPPVQSGWKRALDVAGTTLGNMALPGLGTRVAQNIPGSREAYNRQFNTDVGNYGRQSAAYDKDLNDTLAVQREGRQEDLEHAQEAEAQARADTLKNPPPKEGLTPEETTIHDLMTGENGQPRINPDTQKPYTYLEAYGAVNQAKADTKPTSEKDQEVSDWLASQKLPNTPANRTKARTAIAAANKEAGREPTPDTLAEDANGNPIWVNPRTHQTAPATGVEKTGTKAKNAAANQKALKPYQDTLDEIDEARQFAADPTGSNDYGLLMDFVGVTKPENIGKLRLNAQELALAIKTRGMLGDVEAYGNRIANGEKFIPEQRAQMLHTMEIVGKAAQRNIDRINGGAQGGSSASPKAAPPKTGDEFLKRYTKKP